MSGADHLEVAHVARELANAVALTQEKEKLTLLQTAKGLLYLIISGIFVMGITFILAGIGLVYLGATGGGQLKAFGMEFSATNVGIISIAFGALTAIYLISRCLKYIVDILKMQQGLRM